MWRTPAQQPNEPLASLPGTGCSTPDKALRATASSRCLERTGSTALLSASSFPFHGQRSWSVAPPHLERTPGEGAPGRIAGGCLPGAGVERTERDWSSPLPVAAGGDPAGSPRLPASATQPPARAQVTAAEETATAEPQPRR